MFSICLLPQPARAMAGVGVGRGKIEAKILLASPNIVIAENLAVYNTGESPGLYKMEVMFNERQSQYKPSAEWIEFFPKNFELNPGEAQIVEVRITVPDTAEPGEYFAYLEARQTQDSGISAAAAAKLLLGIDGISSHKKQETASAYMLPSPDIRPFQISSLFAPVPK